MAAVESRKRTQKRKGRSVVSKWTGAGRVDEEEWKKTDEL
jgi:hypothetical protein